MNGQGKAARKTHPALDFLDHSAQVGIIDLQKQGWIVDSSGVQHSATELNTRGNFTVAPLAYEGVVGRWDQDDLKRFLDGEPGPTFGKVLRDMREVINHYVTLKRPQEAGLVACWIVGTYFFPLFPTFPRLNLHGEKGSGKSKLLQMIAGLAFNGLHRISPTPAVLFRLIGPLRPTSYLDEMEGLAIRAKEDISAILNAGYKNGGFLDRTEGDASNRHVVPYPVYAPIALAGISGLNRTTADRAITLNMERGMDQEKLNRYVPADNAAFAGVRAGCYRLALTQFLAVRQAWESLALPSWLIARHRELYAPLLTIATLADGPESVGLTTDIVSLAQEELSGRGAPSQDGEALFHILMEQLAASDNMIVRPKWLAVQLSQWLEMSVTREQAGQLLQRYGFQKDKPPRDRDGVRYRVSREGLTTVITT